MKPDNPARLDDVERAHLIDPSDASFRIGRWAPSPDLNELVRRFWVPKADPFSAVGFSPKNNPFVPRGEFGSSSAEL